MTKEQVLEILKLMDCEIAQVKIKFERNCHEYNTNVLVCLVSDPSNTDQIRNSNHWCLFSNIDEFYKDIEKRIKQISSETLGSYYSKQVSEKYPEEYQRYQQHKD